jgi:DNA-binding FrmR family transcriptional regulator
MVVRPDSPDPAAPSQPETQQHVSGATAVDAALREVCAQIYERLSRLEAAVQRTEGVVADKPWDLSTLAFKRLERVDETLRAVQRSLDDSTLPEMCVNIERQIVQTRAALQRTEQAVVDDSVRQLWQDIDARLVRTEDSLRRTEGIVAGWLKGADETIQRLERIVSSRTIEPSPYREPATIDLMPPPDTNDRAVALPWMAGLAVTAVVLVTLAIGVMFSTTQGTSREQAAVPAAPAQVASPAQSAPSPPREPAVTRATVSGPAPPKPIAQATQPVSARRPVERRPEPQIFVGTLAITSVPSGASVLINGKAAGVTPLRLPRQRAGSLAVQIAQDGFERWSAAVRVPADQLTQVTARLRPIAQ